MDNVGFIYFIVIIRWNKCKEIFLDIFFDVLCIVDIVIILCELDVNVLNFKLNNVNIV